MQMASRFGIGAEHNRAAEHGSGPSHCVIIAAVGRSTDWRGMAHRMPLGRPTTSTLVAALALALLALIAGGALVLHAIALPHGLGSATLSAVVSLAIVLAFTALPKPTLLVFALLMLFRDTIDRYAGYSITYTDDLVVPALFLIVTIWTRPWRTGRIKPLRDGAALAVVGLAVVSSVVNGVPLLVWLPGLVLLAKVIAILYVAAWLDYDVADLRTFALIVGAVAVVAIGLGFVEAAAPHAFADVLGRRRPAVPRGELPSVRSIFFHPVLYGWFSGFVGLFLFAGYAVYRRPWMLVAGLACSIGVVLSARRRAILALLAGVAAGVASELRRPLDGRRIIRGWLPVGALVLLVAAVGTGAGGLIQMTAEDYLPPPVVEPSEPGATAPPGTSGEAIRLTLYRGSVEVASDYFPLGAGLGRYGSWMSRIEYSPLYERLGFDQIWGLSPDFPNFITDTFWPQILGEIGVFGLLAYLLFVALVGLDLWHASRTFRAQPVIWFFTLGALMVFANGLVETLASSMFHSPPRIYLLFGAAGVSLALLRRHRREERSDAAAR
jgi:hypothetical protein